MKFLLPFCFLCLTFILSISNVQAQREESTMTMAITKTSDFCFSVEATTPFISDEIIIYKLGRTNAASDCTVEAYTIGAENTTIFRGDICFDECEYYPTQPDMNSYVINCEAKKNGVVLKDGCVITIGPRR